MKEELSPLPFVVKPFKEGMEPPIQCPSRHVMDINGRKFWAYSSGPRNNIGKIISRFQNDDGYLESRTMKLANVLGLCIAHINGRRGPRGRGFLQYTGRNEYGQDSWTTLENVIWYNNMLFRPYAYDKIETVVLVKNELLWVADRVVGQYKSDKYYHESPNPHVAMIVHPSMYPPALDGYLDVGIPGWATVMKVHRKRVHELYSEYRSTLPEGTPWTDLILSNPVFVEDRAKIIPDHEVMVDLVVYFMAYLKSRPGYLAKGLDMPFSAYMQARLIEDLDALNEHVLSYKNKGIKDA